MQVFPTISLFIHNFFIYTLVIYIHIYIFNDTKILHESSPPVSPFATLLLRKCSHPNENIFLPLCFETTEKGNMSRWCLFYVMCAATFVHCNYTKNIQINYIKNRLSWKKLKKRYNGYAAKASELLTRVKVRIPVFALRLVSLLFFQMIFYPLICKHWTKQSKKQSMVPCCMFQIWIHSELKQYLTYFLIN